MFQRITAQGKKQGSRTSTDVKDGTHKHKNKTSYISCSSSVFTAIIALLTAMKVRGTGSTYRRGFCERGAGDRYSKQRKLSSPGGGRWLGVHFCYRMWAPPELSGCGVFASLQNVLLVSVTCLETISLRGRRARLPWASHSEASPQGGGVWSVR